MISSACLLAVLVLASSGAASAGTLCTSTAGAASAVRAAPRDGAAWQTVWREDFDSFNASRWTKTLGQNGGQLRDAWGTADNVYVQDGALVLRSQRDAAPGAPHNLTSGAVTTRGSAYWSSGRVCVRAKLPGGAARSTPGAGDGVWPAIWMMPNDSSCWPDHGEIDIMEMINGDGQTHGTYHWSRLHPATNCTGSKGNTAVSGMLPVPGDWSNEWHEYGVEYDGESYVAFFLDGTLIVNVTSSTPGHPGNALPQYSGGASRADCTARSFPADPPPRRLAVPFYLILNTALGGPWPKPVTPKTVFPTYHYIDSVVVEQQV